jgi:Leucine-rich repeat (LRR) protein
MKARQIVLLIGVLLVWGCERSEVYEPTEELQFEDAQLQTCVRATGRAEGWTQAGDFKALRCNNGSGVPIANLAGIEVLISLERLDLAFNRISDAELVARLPRLRELDLGHNAIESLPPKLEQLTRLNLDRNRVSAIEWLAGYRRLELLALDQNHVADIAPIAGLEAIRDVRLRHNRIESLAPIAGLSHLERLDVTGNSLTTLEPLRNMKELSSLAVADNRITDLEPLGALTKLVELDVSHNPLTAVAPLRQLVGLERLSLDDTQINDLTPLTSLGRLEVVSLRNVNDVPCAQLDALADIFGSGAIRRPAACR